ncbi:MAG: FAD-binding protein [Pseudomonadales bacterium]|nr:FAD-binding protein [Pseudomonadales bacterium]
MPHWNNWSGRHQARPRTLHHLHGEEDAAALAAAASRDGRRVRATGTGHSHAPLIPTDDVIVDTSGLAGVFSVDGATRRAWVGAGTKIHALGLPLRREGLALANQGDIDRQAISGATATGTHGTGRTLRNLSAAVTGMRIALADGRLVTASDTENTALWRAARLHLGAFGIVTALELALRDAYKLREHGWASDWPALREQLATLSSTHRHFEFFWYPGTDQAFAKVLDETDEPPAYPLADEGSRLAWSYEVFPNHRPHKHTEMEYSVPAERGPACFEAIRTLLRTDFPHVSWPVEYRTLAADDVWLSTAYERDTVTLSVHQTIDEDETDYYRACEAIFRAHDGRPHWGKMHYLSGETLAAIHPRWRDWWRQRDAVDPAGTFLNDYLQQLRSDV